MTCWAGNKPGCRGLGHSAIGSWSRSIYQRIGADQTQAKERALLEDQIRAGGIKSDLWQSVSSGQQCACYKESNQQSDRKCRSCYGTGYVPGFLKFGYTTEWMSVVDTDVTLTNLEITKKFHSAKVILQDGETTGTIESGDKTFSRTAIGSVWEHEAVDFVRDDTNTSVTVEYSLDSGSTWSDISNLSTVNPSSGTIRFRATLTRSSASNLSPLFEIVRARYPRIDLSEQFNGEYLFGPWIRIMRVIPVKREAKTAYGDLPKYTSGFWVTGLSMFDPSITPNTDEDLIDGRYNLIKILEGRNVDQRYIITSIQHSDPRAYLVTQNFEMRVESPEGPRAAAW